MDKEILQRYVEGNVSPEEIIAVVDWLDADESHVREFMALHKLNDISLLNQPDNRADNQKKKRTISFRKIGYTNHILGRHEIIRNKHYRRKYCYLSDTICTYRTTCRVNFTG